MTKKVDINSLLQGISDGTWTRPGGTSWGSKTEGDQPTNHHCPDYAGIWQMAKELGRPPATLIVLDDTNDPFYLSPTRVKDANWFAEIWRHFGFQPGAHIRRIHYLVVSQDPPVMMPHGKAYLNTTTCAAALNNASRDARYLGLISPRDIVDQRNPEAIEYLPTEEETPASVETAGGLRERVPPGFDTPHLDIDAPIIPQRYHIEIWAEKTTQNDILLPLCQRYGINLVTGMGELSLTRCVELIDRARKSGKPVIILYISDFDPNGRGMPVAVARKIEFMVRKEGHDLDIQVRPIVLDHDQCIHYHLPRTPIKETAPGKDRFEERFGAGATELDALEALHPGELARILETEILRYFDDDLDDGIEEVMDEVKGELRKTNAKVKRKHAKALKTLTAERKKVMVAIRAFEKKAKPVLRKIERDLEAAAPDLDDFEWPEPRDGDEDEDPLFHSIRGYVEQIDRYKQHQDKPIERTTYEKVCIECGETFTATRKDVKYHNNECKNKAAYKRDVAAGRSANQRRKAKAAEGE